MEVTTVERLAAHYGLSRYTAVNVLTNTYHWSAEERQSLLDDVLDEDTQVHYPRQFPEDVGEDEALLNLRMLADEAVTAGKIFPSMRDHWLGLSRAESRATTPPGDHPPGYWKSRTVEEAFRAIIFSFKARRTDAALRVVWDVIQSWVAENEVTKVQELIAQLSPSQVDDDLIASLLTLTQHVQGLEQPRAQYLADARRALGERGLSTAEIDAVCGGSAS